MARANNLSTVADVVLAGRALHPENVHKDQEFYQLAEPLNEPLHVRARGVFRSAAEPMPPGSPSFSGSSRVVTVEFEGQAPRTLLTSALGLSGQQDTRVVCVTTLDGIVLQDPQP